MAHRANLEASLLFMQIFFFLFGKSYEHWTLLLWNYRRGCVLWTIVRYVEVACWVLLSWAVGACDCCWCCFAVGARARPVQWASGCRLPCDHAWGRKDRRGTRGRQHEQCGRARLHDRASGRQSCGEDTSPRFRPTDFSMRQMILLNLFFICRLTLTDGKAH